MQRRSAWPLRKDNMQICEAFHVFWPSLVAPLVKNPPAVRETWVQSLSWEDPLKNRTAARSSVWPGEFHGLFTLFLDTSHVHSQEGLTWDKQHTGGLHKTLH